MFLPNIRCQYQRRGPLDIYGKASFEPVKNGMCGIVRLESASEATSVRADSSASRGSAKEELITGRLLFPASVKLQQGDVVIVQGMKLTVQSVWPRHSVTGKLDHWQLDLTVYQGA